MHIAIALAVFLAAVPAGAQEKEKQSIPPSSSYAPVVDRETFQAVRERMSREKDGLMRRQRVMLEQRSPTVPPRR
jgi:hypothetical protein